MMAKRAKTAQRKTPFKSNRKKVSAKTRTAAKLSTAKKSAVKKSTAKKVAMKSVKKKPGAPAIGPLRMIPPPAAVTVRMYRIGHGDCFLLAFPGDAPEKPVYVLIDCGYKPGSPAFIDPGGPTIKTKDIVDDIKAATGGHLDVAVITHEHQDHVNGITAKNFEGFTISEAWFAWTERPDDKVANDLRKQHKDKLLGLFEARNRLAADDAKKVDRFLEFEFGGDEDNGFNPHTAAAMFGAAGGGDSMNKTSMKVFKELAEKQNGVKFLLPHQHRYKIPRAKDVRVFALGPPRDSELLTSLDPEGTEKFHSPAMAAASAGNYFAAAAAGKGRSPFASRYHLVIGSALGHGDFFVDRYYNPAWRRIDEEWLLSAEALALDMNKYTNNTSLALAFELGKGGKVLLFAADAQRGNWVSWSKKNWKDGSQFVTARDLLARTVLYKVGHHGSHNATLDGTASNDYPNLGWMAEGGACRGIHSDDHGGARLGRDAGWLESPAQGDQGCAARQGFGQGVPDRHGLRRDAGGRRRFAAGWKAFRSRAQGGRLYFDYTIGI